MQSTEVIVSFLLYLILLFFFKEWLREHSTSHLAKLFNRCMLDKSDTSNKKRLIRFDLLRSIRNVIMSAKCKGY